AAMPAEAKEPPKPPPPPPIWRVANLKGDANVEVSEGTFGKNGLVESLTKAGLPRTEIKRLAHAFDGLRRIDRPAATDSFVFAKDKAKGTVVAFEYISSPLDVWQARSDGTDDRFIAKKLDVYVEHKRVAS